MEDVTRNDFNENNFGRNPSQGNKVHLWGHKSPIIVDHTSYNFEHDPDLIVEVEVPINKHDKHKTSVGIKRVSSAGLLSGSGTDRSVRSSSARSYVKSRSRPMKPHETEPFLAVDAVTSDRMSVNSARLPERPLSGRKGRAPTVTGKLFVPNGRSPSPYINSPCLRQTMSAPSKLSKRGRNTPASSVYISPTSRQKQKPNVHIKAPFKHSVQKNEASQERASSPSQDLKELTAFATFHVGKMLAKEPAEPKPKVHGRLLKGKLKPLKPVNVTGPTIDKCRGIVSDRRGDMPAANRTLARRREILERIPNVHEYLYDRPRTEESIHRTSRASSLDENRDHIIKEESSDQEGEGATTPHQVIQNDQLPRAPAGSRIIDLGPQGPTPTPRMFVTEINGKGKENTPFDNNMSSKVQGGLELKHDREPDEGTSPDKPNMKPVEQEKAERPMTAGKLVRFAEGSKQDAEMSKGEKQIQNEKIAEGLRENTLNTMSTEPTQAEISMKVDITIRDKEERSKLEENIPVKGEITIIDKGDETEKEQKKSKESCKPEEDDLVKKDDENDDDDNIKDRSDNRFVDSNISPSQKAGNTDTSSPGAKESGSKTTQGKQKSVGHENQSSSRMCRNKYRYKPPSTLQIQSVLHDGNVYYTVGSESPRRSPSPSRSPSPASSSLRSSVSVSKSKTNRLMRPSSANKSKKQKRRSSQSSQSGASMVTNMKTDSTETQSRKTRVYFEGELPPHQSIFTETKVGDETEISLKTDKVLTFDDLEQELAAIKDSIQVKRERVLDDVAFGNIDSELTVENEANELQQKVEENIERLELNSKGQQTDDDLLEDTPKDNVHVYTDLLEMYRNKCMTVSENCGCLSESLVTPGRDSSNIRRRHSFSRPSSAASGKGLNKRLQRRNSFHFGKSLTDTDKSTKENTTKLNREVLFRTPSLVSMTTDSGCSTGFETDDNKIPSFIMSTTDSDTCCTDRSEDKEKPLLAMVCDELPVDEVSGNSLPDQRNLESDPSNVDFKIVAKALEFSKHKPVIKQKKKPVAPFAPLCFTLNARPPTGYLYYFAYGPDMNPSRMSAYLKREVNNRFWGLLYGFQLVFNKKGLDIEAGGFANIEFNPFCSVEGVIYQITQEELHLLDRHVGYPEHYTHLMLPVWMSNSTSPDQYGVAQYCVPAVMYIAQDKWINTDDTVNCDYALQQCIKSSDLVTPDYRDHMVNYCQPIKEQVMCV